VTDDGFDADLVGEALPQPQARAIAAAPFSGDEQSFGLGIANTAVPRATSEARSQTRARRYLLLRWRALATLA
jgi:hypothetical protein